MFPFWEHLILAARSSPVPIRYLRYINKKRPPNWRTFFLGHFLGCDHGHVSPALQGPDEVRGLFLHELYNAVLHGVDGEVGADFNTLAGMNFGAALADQNFTALDGLTVRTLDAEAFGLRIAAVSCRTLG